MKKIALLGIAAATVLAVGLFANIGLFSINALAAEPSTEEKIKIIFRQILNPEFGLKEIKREVRAIEEDLLQKKSFYEVEDQGTIVTSTDGIQIQTVRVGLVNCDESIPVEKRAFNLEMLGLRTSQPVARDLALSIVTIITDLNFVNSLDPTEIGSTDPRGRSVFGPFAASDEMQFVYFTAQTGFDSEEILIKAVAVGQMPQGCEIEVDADAPIPIFEPFPDI